MSNSNIISIAAATVLPTAEVVASTSAPTGSAKTVPKIVKGPDELLHLIEQAETSAREHFQLLRKSIQQSHLILSDSSTPKVGDKKSFERMLQAERDSMARQRALEQEQLRATMQQLADAWQRLEVEQLAQKSKLVNSQGQFAAGNESSSVEGLACHDSGVSLEHLAEAKSSSNSLAELGFQPISMGSKAASAKGNEEMFHKLRSDLLRRSTSKS